MQNEIKVTISGPAGSGKTTIVLMLAEALLAGKIHCEVINEDSVPLLFCLNQEKRIERLVEKNTKVIINEVQIRRA